MTTDWIVMVRYGKIRYGIKVMVRSEAGVGW